MNLKIIIMMLVSIIALNIRAMTMDEQTLQREVFRLRAGKSDVTNIENLLSSDKNYSESFLQQLIGWTEQTIKDENETRIPPVYPMTSDLPAEFIGALQEYGQSEKEKLIKQLEKLYIDLSIFAYEKKEEK